MRTLSSPAVPALFEAAIIAKALTAYTQLCVPAHDWGYVLNRGVTQIFCYQASWLHAGGSERRCKVTADLISECANLCFQQPDFLRIILHLTWRDDHAGTLLRALSLRRKEWSAEALLQVFKL